MTVMERHAQSKSSNQPPKVATASAPQPTGAGATSSVEERRSSLNSPHQPKDAAAIAIARKGSIGYPGTPTSSIPGTGLPNTSNLSLSSTTSTNSSNSKPSNSKYGICSKQSGSPPGSASRRQSGNSITIKVTSENNADLEISGEQLKKFDERETEIDEDVDEADQADDKDRDEGEDDTTTTTSNSISNEQASPRNNNNNNNSARSTSQKKKPKEKKRFVRSSAQQQHHLVYQESEDLGDEQAPHPPPPHRHRLPQIPLEANMNSAFDELFAAAEQGNSTKSAIIEAKMAAEAASLATIEPPSPTSKFTAGDEQPRRSSRSSSFRSNSNNRPRAFSRLLPHHRDSNLDPAVVYGGDDDPNDELASRHLGSPQQLTRSCSCKRPGSFKKMRSKNASPNRIAAASQNAAVVNSPMVGGGGERRDSKSSYSPANGQRRGTQCSITLLEDFEARQQQNRAGSLPFENFIRPQTLAIPNEQQLTAGSSGDQPGAEVYRVRQFVTSKGAVINRGDSFKRSFKRSNQSLSSANGNKRETPSATNPAGSNHLNLPEQGFTTKTSSSSINETTASFNNNQDSTSGSFALRNVGLNAPGDNTSALGLSTPVSEHQQQQQQQPLRVETPLVKAYMVYVLGSPTVGKNALIKQFKTSEYRGTYDICPHQSTDEEPEEGVSISLDGLESRLQFTAMDVEMIKPSSVLEITKDNDAFIVVYSISDKSSFSTATDLLKCIRSSESRTKPVILVGNKSDLVRKRAVDREDGGIVAFKYGCKFVETSVAINDKVDDLLAGILKQIRLSESLERELDAAAAANNEQETSFTDKRNKYVRNYSDAQLHDLIRKTNPKPVSERSRGFLSFKSNTLSRRFFKSSKNRELSQSIGGGGAAASPAAFTTDSIDTRTAATRKSAPNTLSFFHKIYNSIFKRKSNATHLQSVENLFSLPNTMTMRIKRAN